MNKLLTLILIAITSNVSAHVTTAAEYSQLFQHFDGCFILYHVNDQKIVSEYNPHHRCSQQIAPDSTFKVPLSLMAFNQGLINQNTVFKWDGEKRELPDWNQDQTPKSWLKYSVLWVSQQLTPALGYARIKHYLAGFDYGNQDFTGDPGKNNGLIYAWLGSSLKISAVEQLHFIQAMLNHELPVSDVAIASTKENMYLGKLDNGADYYGKTGSGRHGRNERLTNPSRLRDGWFVGFVEQGKEQYIFVSNLTDKTVPLSTDKAYGSFIMKPITLKLLNNYFAK
ncbi:MAG: penicillin-binding transpeptidase domain-containing protein [Gammaproteobacteria bacterium]|nr:penicillin-binding transpeptidase domain-containing protein [Gammaproteobacteria bacterium]